MDREGKLTVDGESDGRLLLGDGGVDLHVRRLLIRGLRHGVAVPAEADLRRECSDAVESRGGGKRRRSAGACPPKSQYSVHTKYSCIRRSEPYKDGLLRFFINNINHIIILLSLLSTIFKTPVLTVLLRHLSKKSPTFLLNQLIVKY